MYECLANKEWLNAFIDNELSDSRKSQVTDHIDLCHDCLQEVKRIRSLKNRISRALPFNCAPSRLKLSVMDSSSAAKYNQQDHKAGSTLFPLGFCDAEVPAGTHICLLYENDQQRNQVIFTYLHAGINCSNKCYYLVGTHKPLDVLHNLQQMGIEVDRALDRGLLNIHEDLQFDPLTGTIVPDNVIRWACKTANEAKDQGYDVLRVAGEVNPARLHPQETLKLIEFEEELNHRFFNSYSAIAICLFDLRRFNDNFIDQILKAHPYVIFETEFKRNPYYTSTL